MAFLPEEPVANNFADCGRKRQSYETRRSAPAVELMLGAGMNSAMACPRLMCVLEHRLGAGPQLT